MAYGVNCGQSGQPLHASQAASGWRRNRPQSIPCQFAMQHDVFLAFPQEELRIRYSGREHPARDERRDAVVTALKQKRGGSDAEKHMADVEIVKHGSQRIVSSAEAASFAVG